MANPNPQFNAIGKQRAVQAMFAEIAPTYDRLNHLLSVNVDKRWRRFVGKKLSDVLARPNALALDLCCGTADLTLELSAQAPQARVIGCDFCHPMLVLGRDKIPAQSQAKLIEGDALRLPFADATFDAVTNAFGLRNLENVASGLQEIHRVLKPGGRVAILEFSRPVMPWLRTAFHLYFTKILPRIGALVSGSRQAYTYLPASVSHFPDQQRLAEMMHDAGFVDVSYRNLSAGIAALHLGTKPENS
ncbi:MAG TPA: bifunctional demethylmenaquinone methyltransferase/2-methoxy-6-polyprenyl-1,4-benzoquinol methylase UbiE [Blastocatellia bacterium]|nr:bifunctional demethylmenaquinone methyltransferase/2-methoxy-6-polyprenyl-1,4-benzoquinol methylase UbiE [Blastocatellia bacterium]